VMARTVLHSPYIELRGDFSEYEAALSREVRQQTRKRRRRLERLGVVDVTFTTSSERWDELLSEGFAVEGSGWKDGRGTAIRSNAHTERFYRQVAHWAAARGTLHLGYLRFDGQCIAFLLSFSERGALYTLKAGFDTRFSRYAPGTILTRDSIAHAYVEGMSSYEFLGDADPYKLHWAREVRERVRLQAFPPSALGAAGWLAWKYARPLARRARASIKPRGTWRQPVLKPAPRDSEVAPRQ
jgi:CelD/BcsL family acetyltransferase involved in cellulose biosynthesis